MNISNVRFFFDPACPWTWITSRWMVEVAEARDIEVEWVIFSLRHRNRDNPDYDGFRAVLNAQHPAVRVLAAAGKLDGNEAVGRLYTALGSLIHHDGDDHLLRLTEAIEMAGLPADITEHADNEAWDAGIVETTEEGRAIIGDDAGIPLIIVPGNPAAFFGPVLSPAPTGADATDLWDAFVSLGRFEGLYEVKRTRSTGPIFGPRPA
ncbi:MAG: disulfide bond formation protein DsbA [Ilumatobacteraceae bacterium]|nr:disulfide bond formation protein DsbA [Ilumatobacteraceae bacterium]